MKSKKEKRKRQKGTVKVVNGEVLLKSRAVGPSFVRMTNVNHAFQILLANVIEGRTYRPVFSFT